MKVVALHLGHNATAAVADGGRVLAAVSEEKVDNVKNSAAFPAGAIAWALEAAELTHGDLDAVLIAGRDVYPSCAYDYLFSSGDDCVASPGAARRTYHRLRGSPVRDVLPGFFNTLERRRARALTSQGSRELKENLRSVGLGELPVHRIEHHHCHARAALHALDESGGTEPALILTLDGSGDGIAGSVNVHDPQSGWRRLATVPVEASLGGYYSNTTRFLGMKILEHEYKVMGLAPYAKDYYLETYERVFSRVVEQDPTNPLTFRARVDSVSFYDYLVRTAVGERFDNIAAAVQHLLEERVVEWVRTAIERTNVRRVFTGGGVFMNVKLNQRIQKLSEVQSIHFMPSCGDESNPFGAAYAFAVSKGDTPYPLDDLYLGPSYSREEIERLLDREGLRSEFDVTEPAQLTDHIADLLARGEVVARFAGRCEWGARSLGNRAILAHPGRMESFFTVNDQIKVRDFWMPFAPSILDRRASDYLADYDPSRADAPHMITAFDATSRAQDELRAALHRGDQTLRPQVVREAVNPEYYRIIAAFESRTGIGAVLNTSFNMHGYPLVANPEQAVFTLRESGLRHLALGPFLMSKR